MSSHLEQFIRDHREEFDSDPPDQKVWENIMQELEPGDIRKTPVIRLNFFRWSAVAVAIMGVTAGLWYFTGTGHQAVKPSLAVKGKSSSPDKSRTGGVQTLIPDSVVNSQGAQKDTPKPGYEVTAPSNSGQEENMEDEEMYHYAKLVEIKHRELKRIQKDEPLLYKKFAGDVNTLDSVYHSLQDQLPKNPNREQLLEAMIQNLQLQMRLLNHQLEIIKQINHSKKSAYENAYKSI
jgi:hypothetical protein